MTLRKILYYLLMIPVLALLLPVGLSGQNQTKRGGIGFRLDENPPIAKIFSYDSLFALHQMKYSFSVTSYVLPLVPSYVDTLKALASRGIELMDNTPTHATQFFNVLNYQDTIPFVNKPGVDHIRGQKICLKAVTVDTNQHHGEGKVNIISNKVISYNPGEFHDLLAPSPYFAIFLNSPVNRLCLYYNVQAVNISDPDTLYVRSFWDEVITISDQWYLGYHKLENYKVVMHDSAVSLLGKRSLGIFDSVNLSRPYTWIQPQGQYPWIKPIQLKNILGNNLKFRESTSFINPALFCYNEYNPQKIKQYSINSQLVDIQNGTFSSATHLIADAISKHYVLFNGASITNLNEGFHAYLQRLDSLLGWCTANNIPVRTYSEWKSILYDSIPQKTINIFPALNVDIDNNNWPDGFNTGIDGVFDQTDGVTESGGKCFRLDSVSGVLCSVSNLAGLEKNRNQFIVYTKGQGKPGSFIRCTIMFSNDSVHAMHLDIPSDSSAWTKYTYLVNIPDSVSIASFTFRGNTMVSDTVKISGINFRSAGFLSRSTYPLQTKTANILFPRISLDSLVVDQTYPPSSLTWTFKKNHHMHFSIDSLGFMKSSRPTSFWTGRDSVYAVARRPDMLTDSCFFRFKSLPVPSGCSGQSISISILDTTTNLDYIVWTSVPYDSTMTDTTIFNPTVSPVVSTHYYVKVYNLLGNISHDSIMIVRHVLPVPGLFRDSTICKGDSILLSAQGGIHYLWSTGDSTASIMVRPDTLTTYTVIVTNQWECSTEDTATITVEKVPVVTISGLFPQYCANDDSCYLMVGYPWYGHFGGSSGIAGSQFCPRLAIPGRDSLWYQATTPNGCYNADTIYVTVNPLPFIPKLPDTTLFANRMLILDAGPGADNYIWSDGATTQTTIADTLHHGLGLQKIWVYVTKEACVSRDTARVNFIKNPSSTNDLLKQELFEVFPNPFSESIRILLKQLPGNTDGASLFDLSGKLLASTPVQDRTTVFSTQGIAPGIYILYLKHNDREYYLKVVKL